jgi:MFS family permease
VAPAIGRVIDRHGPRATLLLCAALFPSALLALVAAVAAGAPAFAVLGCAAVAGASFPPITVCMRTYLRQRMADEAALVTAYSLDSVLIEMMFIVGPLLVLCSSPWYRRELRSGSLRPAASSVCFYFCAPRCCATGRLNRAVMRVCSARWPSAALSR